MLPAGTLPAVAALLVLLTGLGTGAVALTGVRGLRLPAVGLCGLGAPAWLLLSTPLEGRVLLVLAPTHGLTLSDLLAVAGVLLGVLVLRDLRRG